MLLARVIGVDLAATRVIVAARRDPQHAVTVALDHRQIDGNGNASLLLEGGQIDDRDRILVVGHHIATRIGDVDLALDNLEFIGLETHQASVHNLHGHGVDLGDITALLIVGVDLHRSGITRHIGITAVEADKSTVGDIDLVLLLASVLVKHINLVRAVDHTVQVAAVDADVVAHVAHLLGDGGIGIGEDIAHIFAVGIVVVVERGLVPTHIALAQQVKPLNFSKFRLCHRHVLRQEDGYLLAASRQQEQREQYVEYTSH